MKFQHLSLFLVIFAFKANDAFEIDDLLEESLPEQAFGSFHVASNEIETNQQNKNDDSKPIQLNVVNSNSTASPVTQTVPSNIKSVKNILSTTAANSNTTASPVTQTVPSNIKSVKNILSTTTEISGNSTRTVYDRSVAGSDTTPASGSTPARAARAVPAGKFNSDNSTLQSLTTNKFGSTTPSSNRKLPNTSGSGSLLNTTSSSTSKSGSLNAKNAGSATSSKPKNSKSMGNESTTTGGSKLLNKLKSTTSKPTQLQNSTSKNGVSGKENSAGNDFIPPQPNLQLPKSSLKYESFSFKKSSGKTDSSTNTANSTENSQKTDSSTNTANSPKNNQKKSPKLTTTSSSLNIQKVSSPSGKSRTTSEPGLSKKKNETLFDNSNSTTKRSKSPKILNSTTPKSTIENESSSSNSTSKDKKRQKRSLDDMETIRIMSVFKKIGYWAFSVVQNIRMLSY